LSEQLGISRLVVHRAFRELVTEGLLIRMRARGTFVAPMMKHRFMVTGPLFSITEDLSIDALEPSNRILQQQVIAADEDMRVGLKLPENSMVIYIQNLRLAKGLPFSIEEMYLSCDRFPEMARLDLNNRSIYHALDKTYACYPQEAQDNGIQGRVYMTFVVERDGSVSTVNIVRGVHPSLDSVSVRAIKSSPKWTPGLQRGRPVRVRFSMFLNFTL